MYSPLLTDLYQLTMAYGYWKLKMHEQEAVFHLLFRKNPFQGNYALSCGTTCIIDFLDAWKFKQEDLDYLATLTTSKNEPIFTTEFLNYLQNLKFSCDIDAIPEGTVIFPHAPFVRIQGPLIQCQLIESPLLNILNFQTLIATKASRVCKAAGKDSVIEFGMRRAQGPDGALSASRASYIGGCVATSNVLAGKLYDIPVRGTHAHSWVSSFSTEKEAFTAYADVMPNNCVLLVDTYNTLEGVKNAIEIGKKLKEQGSELLAIRLDSGDLATLSIEARKLLDAAGMQTTGILASNSLDEYAITEIKNKGGQISSWGVGTNLATSYDQPALDGVYKLSALKNQNGEWVYKLKLSEQEVKISNPGIHQVRRFFCNEKYFIDVIYDINLGISDTPSAIVLDATLQKKRLDDFDGFVDLLEPVYRKGNLVCAKQSIHELRKKAMNATEHYYQTYQNAPYTVALEENLFNLKHELIETIKQKG